MNIAKFLGTGKTFVHAPSASVLAKAGAALVLSMALASGVHASERVNQVTQLAPPTDMASTFYQGLVGSGDTKLMVVSTQSADLNRILNTMPGVFAHQLASRAASNKVQANAFDFLEAVGRDMNEAFTYKLSGSTLLRDQQSLCFVHAAEAIHSDLKATLGGVPYYAIKTPGGVESIHSADDAMFFTTVHELYHCSANQLYGSLAKAALGDGGEYYGVAVDEMLADLAVVLTYASMDGDSANGMATIRGMRAAALADIEHNTEDMLDYVLGHLDASQFRGMQASEIMGVVQDISRELDPVSNQTLKEIYAVSATEKVMLAERLFGENDELRVSLALIHGALDTDGATANAPGRATKLLDALITLNVKNAQVQHQLPDSGVGSMIDLADKLGVKLPVYQQARAAVFDSTVSPGGPAQSPWLSDHDLRIGTHMNDLFEAHVQRMNAVQQTSASVGPR